MTQPESRPNSSLQRKTASRMAAAQCLYTAFIRGASPAPEQQAASLRQQLSGNRGEQMLQVGAPFEPNYKLLETILAGVAQWKDAIDERLDRVLSAEWTRERMSPLLIALLQCAIFELLFDKDLPANIVIDEYSRLTRSFFGEAEVNFIHAALRTLAQTHG